MVLEERLTGEWASALLLAILAAACGLCVAEWPFAAVVLVLALSIALGALVDYKSLYFVWLFTLPFLRNFVNIRTVLFDLKPSYILFLPVASGLVFATFIGRWRALPRARPFRRLYFALASVVVITALALLGSPALASGLRAVPRMLYVVAVVLVTVNVMRGHGMTLRALKVLSFSLLAIILLGFGFYVSSSLPGGYVVTIGQHWPATVTEVNQELLVGYSIGTNAGLVRRYAVGLGNLYDTSGDFAMIGTLLFLAWASCVRRPSYRRGAWVCAAVCSLALLLTYSRGAWLSTALGLLVLLYAHRKRWAFRLVALGMLLLVVYLAPKAIIQRAETPDISVLSRAARAEASLEIVRQHPILGGGPGGFTEELTAFHEHWQAFWIDPDEEVSAHSAILQYLGEQGALGLAALCSLFFLYIALGLKLLRRVRGASRNEHVMAFTMFAAFVAFFAHSFALPAFEDLFWATFAIGYVLAAQTTAALGRSSSPNTGPASAF